MKFISSEIGVRGSCPPPFATAARGDALLPEAGHAER